MRPIIIALVLGCLGPVVEAQPVEQRVDLLLTVLREKESSGNDRAVGDGGRARGPLQIHKVYWIDGCEKGRVKWQYLEKVWSWAHSRQVALWYWQRHCPKALRSGDLETLARVHNGGPSGARKAATLGYWADVRARLAEKGVKIAR